MSAELPDLDFARLAPPAGARMAVVGGCGGIGRALVAASLEIGLEVAVLDLPVSFERHGVPDGVRFHSLDATKEYQVATAFEALGRAWDGLEVLVNLCGFAIMPLQRVAATEAAAFDETVAGNLRSVYLAARRALPMLHAAGGGSIVHAASTLALRTIPGFAPYSAAKAGVIAFTKAVAIENAPKVRANAIAPSAVDTAFLTGGTGRGGEDRNKRHVDLERYLPTVPMGRLAVAEDVVGPILFLAGPAARYITGQVLYVNGGAVTP